LGVKRSRDRYLYVTAKELRAQYLENSSRCYLATIANYFSLLWGSMVGYPSDTPTFRQSCTLD